jgi:uncharacterized pyridoxal phosphate-containing UPF0001 family protein
VTPPPALVPAPPPAVVAARLDDVWRRVRASGRDPATVRVVAVTKGFDVTAVRAALLAGVSDIGENYATELVAKAADLAGRDTGDTGAGGDDGTGGDDGAGDEVGAGGEVGTGGAGGPGEVSPRWHFLGAVQRRRVRDLAPLVGCWQTLARAVEGEAIAGRAPGARVLVEVETSGRPGRNGCRPALVPELVRQLQALELDVGGLMVVAPPGTLEEARAAFRTTARLAADLGLVELSMGMTQDLEVALEEGATMVRVGRALFGPRPGADPVGADGGDTTGDGPVPVSSPGS